MMRPACSSGPRWSEGAEVACSQGSVAVGVEAVRDGTAADADARAPRAATRARARAGARSYAWPSHRP
eukprot:COSAG06_NODE_8370_length_2192_cov_2.341615_1_plen_67_part_10